MYIHLFLSNVIVKALHYIGKTTLYLNFLASSSSTLKFYVFGYLDSKDKSLDLCCRSELRP